MEQINKQIDVIMKFRDCKFTEDNEFKTLIEAFRDLCISYGRLDHAKNDKTLENVFDSMNTIFKPDNQN